MGDIERWLVEKENNRKGRVEDATTANEPSSSPCTVNEMQDGKTFGCVEPAWPGHPTDTWYDEVSTCRKQ